VCFPLFFFWLRERQVSQARLKRHSVFSLNLKPSTQVFRSVTRPDEVFFDLKELISEHFMDDHVVNSVAVWVEAIKSLHRFFLVLISGRDGVLTNHCTFPTTRIIQAIGLHQQRLVNDVVRTTNWVFEVTSSQTPAKVLDLNLRLSNVGRHFLWAYINCVLVKPFDKHFLMFLQYRLCAELGQS
jgi:hypothetical protein